MQECAEALLEASADPNQKNNAGKSALICAAEFGYTRCIQRLVTAGGDLNAGDNLGYTPLMWASQNNQPVSVSCLLELGADVNVKNDDGWTPLFDCAISCALEPAKLLVGAGIDVNADRGGGSTALKMACLYGPENYTELVSFLLESKADVNVGDLSPPLHAAVGKGRAGVVRLLLEHGALVDASMRMALSACENDEIKQMLADRIPPVEPEEAVDMTHLAQGAGVLAKYTIDGDSWYDAKIVCKNEDGSYDLAWNDGDTQHTQGKTCDELKVRASQLLPEHLALLASGDQVECFYRANTKWFGATIQQAVLSDGTLQEFQILWNDGDASDSTKQLEEVRFPVSLVTSKL
jgi:predicted RNase H-like HicB family nuclease